MRIDVVSGSRADRGPLIPVTEALRAAGHAVCDVVLNNDVTKDDVVSVLEATSGHLETAWVNDQNVDLAVVLGDRYELLGVTTGYYLRGIPIAHLSGGDLTAGSADDSRRHAITKLSHLHFVTCEESASRVVQMGEDPSRVHVVGCPGIDRIHQLMPSLPRSREVLLDLFGPRPPERYLLVCYHPDTSGEALTGLEATSIADAVYWAQEEYGMGSVLLDPCCDLGSSYIKKKWDRLHCPELKIIRAGALDQPRFLSLLHGAVALVGNSSAGFYEAPCFSTPVVNVGRRQEGRTHTELTMDVDPRDICAGIHWAIVKKVQGVVGMRNHPYGDGHAAERITNVISSVSDPRQLLRKTFYSGDNPWRQTPSGKKPTLPKNSGATLQNISSAGSTATSRGGRAGAPLDF